MASSCWILSVLRSTSIGGGVADASYFNSSNLADPLLYCSACKRSYTAIAATTAYLALSRRLLPDRVLLALVVDDVLQTSNFSFPTTSW